MKHYKTGKLSLACHNLKKRLNEIQEKCLDAGMRLFKWFDNFIYLKVEPFIKKVIDKVEEIRYEWLDKRINANIKLVTNRLDRLDVLVDKKKEYKK